ncbi:MAG: tryptophan synthase subunit alpha [Lachnospiraceae bacterium]|jgi:tryptophan synthase alpha chain|nr:tryptophan synthase subunit alpha [Lachnospiraceae bacterium]MEE3460667.1 tryptophan synthase subunit alpha [Lachnospiraceae bacterium]
MSRISDAFNNKKLFIPFITAGDPDLDSTYRYVLKMVEAGAGLIELGVPFSDPIAEGPVIQSANVRSLSHGTTIDDIFELVKRLRKETRVPIVFMGYLNSFFKYGYDKICQNTVDAGADGFIIPDLPFEEKDELKEYTDKYGLELISMIAPTSKERIRAIASEANGFIYLVSSLGVTGTRDKIETDVESIVKEIRKCTDTPVAVGFGIHTPEQVRKVVSYADGAIVGSAIVNIAAEKKDKADQAIYDYVKSMADAL